MKNSAKPKRRKLPERCRVEKAFGLSMDMLLRMQVWNDATQTRARADESTCGAISQHDRSGPAKASGKNAP